MRVVSIALSALAVACGPPHASDDAAVARPDAAPHVPGNPGPGAHALAYYTLSSHADTLATPAMATAATGSTIVVSTGRGVASASVAPTDSLGNAYTALDEVRPYSLWPFSGTAIYAATDVTGGVGHVVQAMTPSDDELTLAAVEVIDGTTIADVSWIEVLAPAPLTSAPVTTTGPATLVAFWWGDAGVDSDKTAVPDGGFAVVEEILMEGALVQCAVAVREVTEPGTYDVTWTSTPVQGAQLWLVAVQ